MARIGNTYQKMKDYANAVKYLEMSLTEAHNEDVKKKLMSLKKIIKEEEELKYRDPIKAEEAREEGNLLFKKGFSLKSSCSKFCFFTPIKLIEI